MTEHNTDPAATAAAALKMELPECPECGGYMQHTHEFTCHVCNGTGRQGGATAQVALDGLRELLKEATDGAEGCKQAEAGYDARQAERAAQTMSTRCSVYEEMATSIAAVIRRVCGEGE